MVLDDVEQLPVLQLFQRSGQILVVERAEPTDRPQPVAYAVEPERGIQPFVRLAEGMQDRGVQLGAIALHETEHVRGYAVHEPSLAVSGHLLPTPYGWSPTGMSPATTVVRRWNPKKP